MDRFDSAPRLSGFGLELAPLAAADREALYEAARDPLIWEQHPARNRHERDVFDAYFDFLIAAGGTLLVRAAGEVIGCSRYYTAADCAPQIAVGFTFLVRAHWGGTSNFALKSLMFGHVFEKRDEVWLHVGPDNIRSQTATGRLGAELMHQKRLDLGTGEAEYLSYRLKRRDWEAVVKARKQA